MRIAILAVGTLAPSLALAVIGHLLPPPDLSTIGNVYPTAVKVDRDAAAAGIDGSSEPKTMPSFFEAIAPLTRDPNGFIHVGDDGIVRSFAYDGSVIDHRALHNEQLLDSVKQNTFLTDDERQHLDEVFEGVSGHDVTDLDQIHNPPAHLKPRDLRTPELLKQWQGEVDESNVSKNPNAAVIRTLKRQAWSWDPNMPACYGSSCTNHDACYFMGCLDCISYDNMPKGKICLGVQPSPPPSPPPVAANIIWGICPSFPYCYKKA